MLLYLNKITIRISRGSLLFYSHEVIYPVEGALKLCFLSTLIGNHSRLKGRGVGSNSYFSSLDKLKMSEDFISPFKKKLIFIESKKK